MYSESKRLDVGNLEVQNEALLTTNQLSSQMHQESRMAGPIASIDASRNMTVLATVLIYIKASVLLGRTYTYTHTLWRVRLSSHEHRL